MSLWGNLKAKWTFHCDICGRSIEPGEFMSIVAKSPVKSYSGSMIPLINKFVKDTEGKIYCRACFSKRYGEP